MTNLEWLLNNPTYQNYKQYCKDESIEYDHDLFIMTVLQACQKKYGEVKMIDEVLEWLNKDIEQVSNEALYALYHYYIIAIDKINVEIIRRAGMQEEWKYFDRDEYSWWEVIEEAFDRIRRNSK